MGMVLAMAALVGFGGGAVAGIIGVVLFILARARKRGPLLPFIFISVLVPLLMGGFAVFLFNDTQSSGAPTSKDYEQWLTAAFLFGLAPCTGLFTGGVGIFVYSLIKPAPEKETP